ncbi:IS200/IS605 family element transposase accessory protein TnpB [Aceticella autotrophica]|uniref:IS200/IS605 family element transposase accessory protein TnpB n=1 Tax=Aceticella autotrophica TaxID=2755338 RepID=A0A975AWX9_9THEO|nr:RNA-guided endonuclease TnpB family protein [Aceticella autotrophica]QSZ27959.1 IS200/IS605 family element transposase accessory protein TnpB [Aceticella autotrophica]
MKISQHFRIEPTKEQESKLFHTLYLCRKFYNYSLEQRIKSYQETGKGLSYKKQQNMLPQYKEENLEYKAVQSQILQDVLRRLYGAYKKFFAKEAGYPHFKDKYHYYSITLPQCTAKRNFKKEGYVYIPYIGDLKMIVHRDFDPNTVKTINIKYHAGKWYANLSIEIPEGKTENITKYVGLDKGVKVIGATSDGKIFENPKWIQNAERRLKRLQRQLSKKKKGSKNREKQKKRLQKLHEKVANQRKDYLHKISYRLTEKYDAIFVEDLQVKNMTKNHKLAKSIANVGWGMLDTFLEYKSLKKGKLFKKINPAYTTQKCSRCGKIVEKDLSVRIHKCECGLEIDRDINAAINILHEGLRQLAV